MMFPAIDPADRLLRLPEVVHLTGMKRSTIYRKQSLGEFPKCLHIGSRCSVWPLSSINDWMERVKQGGTWSA